MARWKKWGAGGGVHIFNMQISTEILFIAPDTENAAPGEQWYNPAPPWNYCEQHALMWPVVHFDEHHCKLKKIIHVHVNHAASMRRSGLQGQPNFSSCSTSP